MSATTITLSIDNLRGDDLAPLYHRYPQQINAQPAYVEMTESGEVSADYSGEIGNAVPMTVWHRRTLRWSVPSAVRGPVLADLLESEPVQALLQRVYDGHSVDWDGSNHVGHLDDDASAASDELERLFEEISDNDGVAVWSVGDWLFNCATLLDSWQSGPLADAVSAIETAAVAEGVYLDGDIADELLDQAAGYVADEKPGLTHDHLSALITAGKIDADQADEYRAAIVAA